MPCLFCNSDTELTEEHTFPAAIGGGEVLPKGTCKACNGRFSQEFEEEFVRGLTPVRYLLQVPDRRGKVPNLKAAVTVEGKGHTAKILAGGEVKIPPVRIEMKTESGGTEIIYRTFSKEDAQRLKQNVEKKGYKLEEAPIGTIAQEFHAEVYVPFDFIGANSALRTVAKIALVSLALRAGEKLAGADTFTSTRDFISSGTGKSPARLFLNENFRKSFHIGPHQHALVLTGERKTNGVYAVVVIFGGLSYFIHLSNVYEGADFNYTYAYNAQKAERCEVLVSNEQNEFLLVHDVMEGATAWGDVCSSADSFMTFLSGALGFTFG